MSDRLLAAAEVPLVARERGERALLEVLRRRHEGARFSVRSRADEPRWT
jgi:hypothetical protein